MLKSTRIIANSVEMFYVQSVMLVEQSKQSIKINANSVRAVQVQVFSRYDLFATAFKEVSRNRLERYLFHY